MQTIYRTCISALALVHVSAIACNAAEIKLFAAFGIREVVEDLAPKFERASGHKIAVTFGNLGALVKRINDGETADVIIIPQQGIVGLVKNEKATSENVTVVARGGIGVAVRKGAQKPDIATPDAFKRTLIVAKSVTYLDPSGGGVSGTHVVKVIERLGLQAELKPKTILHRNSTEAAVLVADGKAEIGINLIQELMPKPGIDVVGPLPGDLQYSIVYAAAILPAARDVAATRAWVSFMRTPDAAIAIRAKGMEPN